MSKPKQNNVVNFPSNLSEGEREVEAIMFAADEPLYIDTIESKISKKIDVEKILKKIQSLYSTRGINLVCISNRWSFRTAKNLSNLMGQQKTVEKKLSKAAVETLAIIVYHQPVTRAEIEEIRGVAFGTNTLDILMELNWVKPHGRKNVPGKPIQYATTEDLLSHFNLQKLSDLPTVDELGSAGLIDSKSIDSSVFGTGKFYKEKQEKDKKENIYSAAYSRFGVMFFEDSVVAFRNINKSLIPGASLSFVCWQSPTVNPWQSLFVQEVKKFMDLPSLPPRSPGPFAFKESEYVTSILEESDFQNIKIEGHEAEVNMFP